MIQRDIWSLQIDLYSVRLAGCGSVDVYLFKIRRIVDNSDLAFKDANSNGEHAFYLSGLPSKEEWNLFKQLVRSREGRDRVQNSPTELGIMMLDREAEIRKERGDTKEVVMFSENGGTKKSRQ